MPSVCTDRNLAITAGVLGIEKWSAPRMVAQQSATSTADGSISSPITTQPGTQLIDASMSWVSDSPLDLWMRLQIIRSYWSIHTSNPNVIQIWDSWMTGVDEAAAIPNNYGAANGLCTLGIDVGVDTNSQPFGGIIQQDYPVNSTEDWIQLPAGSTLNVRYRCYVWTPPPWSNNANANSPNHAAYARGAKLRLWAYPSADQAVR